ncbi:MAG TPA: HAD family hydrolase [Candidatus Limnocylindrales bacterium]|nr:HAD family hydrolase [Candidatus Limnocylindrales bacterium]
MTNTDDQPAAVAGSSPERADPLDGIELVVFDKDGTLIEFHRMWRDWVGELGDRLGRATGRPMRAAMYGLMGVDERSGTIDAQGLLAATPMNRLRELVVESLTDEGLDPATAEQAVAVAWDPPDPVVLAHPTADLPTLFGRLAAQGIRAAVATSDDRRPTERTLEALGVADRIEALACADDGFPGKPAPDSVLRIAAELRVPPERILVVGDAPADLRMGRAAGVRRVVGVLTGVGDEATLSPLADLVLDSVADLAPG